MYALADKKQTTVADLLGARKRYSRIKVPSKLQDLVGDEYLEIEHYDEGISSTEVLYWTAFYEIEAKRAKDEIKKK